MIPVCVCIFKGRLISIILLAPLLLDQSTISIGCHDNKNLTFAHLFKRSRQRDQVGVALVTSLP